MGSFCALYLPVIRCGKPHRNPGTISLKEVPLCSDTISRMKTRNRVHVVKEPIKNQSEIDLGIFFG
jgi:hypothetical protein